MKDGGGMSAVARVVVRVFLVANIACAAGFLAAIVLSFPLAAAFDAHLPPNTARRSTRRRCCASCG